VWVFLKWTDDWWVATILAFAPRWVCAVPMVVLLPATLCRRRQSLLVILLAGIVAWPIMGFNVPWSRLFASGPHGTPFRVMTCNMHYSQVAPDALEGLIGSAACDLVVIQEWPGARLSRLQASPDWNVRTTPRLFLASRYPIRAVKDLNLQAAGGDAVGMRYDLDIPIGVVHVFSVHLSSDREGISEAMEGKGPLREETNSVQRYKESELVVAQAAECQGPVLIMGDFNTPPESVFFADVWKGYTDTFSSSGWGWGFTFYGARTMVRIDHVLAGPCWTATGCQVGANVGSPHRPLIAELVWSDARSSGVFPE